MTGYAGVLFLRFKVFTLSETNPVSHLLVLRGSTVFLQPCISVNNYEPAYFGSGTKLTVLGKKMLYIFFLKVKFSAVKSRCLCLVISWCAVKYAKQSVKVMK